MGIYNFLSGCSDLLCLPASGCPTGFMQTPANRPVPGWRRTGLAQFSEPFAGFSTTNLYVQGIAPGTNLLEWSYSEQADCVDEILLSIFKVELFLNNTTNQQDDIVVKEITSGNYRAGAKDGTANAQNIGLGTIGTQGPTNNHIPMTIRLSGPTNFFCNVKLFDSSPVGGGDVAIRMTNGVVYPATGCLMTAGTDYEVHIYGQTESSSLNDVKIEAKTDLTGNSVCADEDLSVLFVTLSFKGVGSFSANNSINLSALGGVYAGLSNACGLYQMDMTNADARVFNVMEIEVTIKPDDQPIPGVTWDIKREKERTEWTDGVPLHSPIPYSTTTTVSDDDSNDSDEDLTQGSGDLRIYSIDTVGLLLQSATTNRTKILNFREWVEVRVPQNGQAPNAASWFVASEYEYWHVLLKATNSGTLFNPNWTRIGHSGAGSIPSADNEVESGNYTNAVTTWTEH